MAAGNVVIIEIHTNAVGTITDNNGATPCTESKHQDLVGVSSYSIYVRVCGGSEPSAYAFIGSASNRWSIQVRAFSGVDSGIWDVTPPNAATGTGTTATAASITTLTANALAIYFGGVDSATATFSAPTNGFATEVEPAANQGQATYTKAIAVAGAVGSTAATLSGSLDWFATLGALKASVASTPQMQAVDAVPWHRVARRDAGSVFETIAPEQFAQTLFPSATYDDRMPRRARRAVEYPFAFETIAPEQFDQILLWGASFPDGRLLRPRRLLDVPSVFHALAQETFPSSFFQAEYQGPVRPVRARRLTEYLTSTFGTIAPEQFARDLLAGVMLPEANPTRARRPREYPFAFETIAPEQFAVTLWWSFSASYDRPVRARRLLEYPFAFWSTFTPAAATAPDLCMTVLPADFRRYRPRSPAYTTPIAPWLVRVPPGSTLKDFDFLGPVLPPAALRRFRQVIHQFMMAQGETSAIALVPDHGLRVPEVRDEFLTIPFAFDIMWTDSEDGGEFLIRPYGR